MEKSLVILALAIALLMTAIVPSAVMAQEGMTWAQQQASLRQMADQQNASWSAGSGYYQPGSISVNGYYQQPLVVLGTVIVAKVLDNVFSKSSNQPQAQPCPAPTQPVVIQQTPASQPTAPPVVVVNNNNTVIVIDGAVTVPTAQIPVAAKPAGITGPVTLCPLGMDVTIPAAKPISVGTQIWFVRNNQIIGKFTVKAIFGQTVTLECVSGGNPTNGDGFAIINN